MKIKDFLEVVFYIDEYEIIDIAGHGVYYCCEEKADILEKFGKEEIDEILFNVGDGGYLVAKIYLKNL